MTQPEQTPAHTDPSDSSDTIDAASLIEEVSIDGMCGVY